jgi:hypothetical protein
MYQETYSGNYVNCETKKRINRLANPLFLLYCDSPASLLELRRDKTPWQSPFSTAFRMKNGMPSRSFLYFSLDVARLRLWLRRGSLRFFSRRLKKRRLVGARGFEPPTP